MHYNNNLETIFYFTSWDIFSTINVSTFKSKTKSITCVRIHFYTDYFAICLHMLAYKPIFIAGIDYTSRKNYYPIITISQKAANMKCIKLYHMHDLTNGHFVIQFGKIA